MMLRIVYTFFTGLLLATFVGVGIAAFYTAPERPEYPERLLTENGQKSTTETLDSETEATWAQYDQALKEYDAAFNTYSRNVSLVALVSALLLMTSGLLLAEKLDAIADGLLLGGLFTLVYSIGWGFSAEDNTYRFLVVTVGLLVALGLGYAKFIAPSTQQKQRS